MSTPAANESSASETETAYTEETPLLEVEGLKKHFSQSDGFLDRIVGDTGTVKAVDGVDLTLREGETLAVVGESGCGKSTLGRTLLNLDDPTDGAVRFRGEDIAGLSDGEMRPYRRDMQMIFQNPLASLNPRQSVQELLVAPMEVHDVGDSKDERVERAGDVLERVGLQRQHLDRYPHQFSGGQQQRIAIARVLTLEPDFMVADEPTSALDVSVQAQLLNLLEDLQEDLGLSMLFITHDLSVVRHVADRVAVMYLGQIVEIAPVAELFEDPQHPYTKSLLSAVPRTNPDAREDRILIEGTVPSPIDPPSGCRFHTRCPVVIPPEDWDGTQEQFRAAFTFRNRVESDEIDVDDVRRSISNPTDERVVDEILSQSLPVAPSELPAETRDTVEEAAAALVDDRTKRAVTLLADSFTTPCARDEPSRTVAGDDHQAHCHRLEE
jgi:peptide/nickel transport system ATP-binding protein